MYVFDLGQMTTLTREPGHVSCDVMPLIEAWSFDYCLSVPLLTDITNSLMVPTTHLELISLP